MKLTKEQIKQIIKEEIVESYGDMFDQYNPEGHPEPEIPTMSGDPLANALRQAIVDFATSRPFDDPKATVMAIVNEVLK